MQRALSLLFVFYTKLYAMRWNSSMCMRSSPVPLSWLMPVPKWHLTVMDAHDMSTPARHNTWWSACLHQALLNHQGCQQTWTHHPSIQNHPRPIPQSPHFDIPEAKTILRAAKQSLIDYWPHSAITLHHSNNSHNVSILLAVLCPLPAPLQETHSMRHFKTARMALRRMEWFWLGVSEQNYQWRRLHARHDEEV